MAKEVNKIASWDVKKLYIAKVIGNVVSTKKDDSLIGSKLMILKVVHADSSHDVIVAVDLVGSGVDDYVLVSCGSAARQTFINQKIPVDAAIVGIIDNFNEGMIKDGTGY
ncbi:EutN/CcmL family microcompartment protein [Liquorilactobacillus nagelii]|uniref:EutN/CcmL family microcompartment protein n=1 Tax=Liquorilactobacillus nagelii TaxID=82688 RepID=UPI00290571C1|nr:EutN/CcmL family microcompartment protein [Liquorilactobacillus nagelii]